MICEVCGEIGEVALRGHSLCKKDLFKLNEWIDESISWKIKVMHADYEKAHWLELHGSDVFVCPFCDGDFRAPIDSEDADEHRRICRRPMVKRKVEFSFD